MGSKFNRFRWDHVRKSNEGWSGAIVPDAAGTDASMAWSGESDPTAECGTNGTGECSRASHALPLTDSLTDSYAPPPPRKVDVIFALAKGNWHCGVASCRKPLNPWAAKGADDAMCCARSNNYIFHNGMRGPTAADNNLKPEFCCYMCMNKGEF